MKFAFLFVVLALLALNTKAQMFSCMGSPILYYGMRDYNCYAICCPEGFVMDLNTTGTIGCVSCDSVGLIACASCTLIPFEKIGNLSYKCLVSKNIPQLITIGIQSVCGNHLGENDKIYGLSNYSNYKQCVPCSYMIPHAATCMLETTCQTKIFGQTGNNCTPYLRAIGCESAQYALNYVAGQNYSQECLKCGLLIYGCLTCFTRQLCTSCDNYLGVELKLGNNKCTCMPQADCILCGLYQERNVVTRQCQCVTGYSNVSGNCMRDPRCIGVNEAWNFRNTSCICKIGYFRGAVGTPCVLLTCRPFQEVTKTGVCECIFGYTRCGNAASPQCCVVGSFLGETLTLSYQYGGVNNQSSYYNLTNYVCGCPINFTRKGDACIRCQLAGTKCQCQPGYYWNSTFSSCRLCSEINNPSCLECGMANGYRYCNRCAPGYNLRVIESGPSSSCQFCNLSTVNGRGCTLCPITVDQIKQNNTCKVCKIGSFHMGPKTGFCAACSDWMDHCISCQYFQYSGTTMETKLPCRLCQYPYVILNARCVCPGTYDNKTKSCIPCQVGCNKCLGNTCLQCNPNFIKDSSNTSCVCVAPGLLPQYNCQNCKNYVAEGTTLIGCISCKTRTQCNNCATGYYLNPGGQCESCNRQTPGCMQCTNISKCTKCDARLGFQLRSDSCVCASTSVRNGDLCMPCNRFVEHCNKCNAENNCQGCEGNYILNDNKNCECPRGYAEVNDTCILCSTLFGNCILCNSTNCLGCRASYALGTANTSSANLCIQRNCSGNWGCVVCVGGQYCTECIAPAQARYGFCQCPFAGSYRDQFSGTCFACNSLCQQCNQLSRCSKCISDKLQLDIYGQKCYCNTRQPTYYNSTRDECLSCSVGCLDCKNSTYCNQCESIVKILVNGECLCPYGSVPGILPEEDCIPTYLGDLGDVDEDEDDVDGDSIYP